MWKHLKEGYLQRICHIHGDAGILSPEFSQPQKLENVAFQERDQHQQAWSYLHNRNSWLKNQGQIYKKKKHKISPCYFCTSRDKDVELLEFYTWMFHSKYSPNFIEKPQKYNFKWNQVHEGNKSRNSKLKEIKKPNLFKGPG